MSRRVVARATRHGMSRACGVAKASRPRRSKAPSAGAELRDTRRVLLLLLTHSLPPSLAREKKKTKKKKTEKKTKKKKKKKKKKESAFQKFRQPSRRLVFRAHPDRSSAFWQTRVRVCLLLRGDVVRSGERH